MQMKTHVKADGMTMNRNQTLVRDRVPEAQSQHAALDAVQVNAVVGAVLRNTLGLALIYVGFVGTIYLLFGTAAR
jgi:hypothetical protein